ncbi:GNAT family N-acetyltransferase [Methylobacterium fujisawaense]|uniref:GNAT family N-acetyltransferase n=1 Tax=Methylobacterium fujisawaense TaxID=107400 RepID=UPI003702C532
MAGSQSSELKIRSVCSDDHAIWLPLWKGYLAFYKASISDEVTDSTWKRLLDENEAVYGALAFNEMGTAVGLVHYLPHRSTWTIGTYCYLQDLFVDEDGRGLGAGRSLIEHVYQEANKLNCSRVYWLTHETNQTAILLYDKVAERSGFIQYRKMLGNK